MKYIFVVVCKPTCLGIHLGRMVVHVCKHVCVCDYLDFVRFCLVFCISCMQNVNGSAFTLGRLIAWWAIIFGNLRRVSLQVTQL